MRAIASVIWLGVAALASAAALDPRGAVGRAARAVSRRAEPPGQGCVTSGCHGEYRDLRVPHGPVALGLCLLCHEYDEEGTPFEAGEAHRFDVVDDDGRLCARCHESQASEAYVHYPIRQLKCLTCHDPHGSDHPGMVRQARMIGNCYACHEPKMDDEPLLHAPVRAGECTFCHDPHGSPNPFQLVASGPRLCTRCHTDIADELAGSLHAHRPVLEDCTSCHLPHDGKRTFLLEDEAPRLCLGCHEDMAAHIEQSTWKHGALDEKASCLVCHDPHASDLARQLVDKPVNLCLSCHDESIVGADRVIIDMKSYLEENPDHHGPIRTGDCAACHDPHGSDQPRLLFDTYPGEFYTSFDPGKYSLCFYCHERSIVLDAETETVTGFRNGSQNLHFVHVNRIPKGRTCRACHDVHASRHPKHIADGVPFGIWTLPIGYEPRENGGSCAPGCHAPRSFDRLEAVENP